MSYEVFTIFKLKNGYGLLNLSKGLKMIFVQGVRRD